MMPSLNSTKLLQGLIEVSYDLSEVITAKDEFHPNYKKDRDFFRRLIAARLKLERAFKRYFKEASARIHGQIDWVQYGQDVVQAVEYTSNVDWDDERLQLLVTFVESAEGIYGLGIEQMEKASNLDTGLTTKEYSFQKALREHGLDLAKSLTDTTKERLRQSLKTSIAAHKNMNEAAEAVNSVIDDPNRAKMIARTETVNAHSKGVLTAGREMGAKKKRWLYGGPIKGVICPICAPMDNVVVAIDKQFHTPNGDVDGPTAHPYCVTGDTSISAPGLTKIMRIPYRGEVFDISFAGGHLTVSPNHVILTDRGWVSAKFLRERDKIANASKLQGIVSSDPNADDFPPTIEEVFSSGKESNLVASKSMPIATKYFHGDGRFGYGDVDIISANGFLTDTLKSLGSQKTKSLLLDRREYSMPFTTKRDVASLLIALSLASDSIMSGSSDLLAILMRHFTSSNDLSLGHSTGYDARFKQMSSNDNARDFEFFSDAKLGFSKFISFDNVLNVKHNFYHGFLYDVSTTSTLYISNSIISSNCLCLVENIF